LKQSFDHAGFSKPGRLYRSSRAIPDFADEISPESQEPPDGRTPSPIRRSCVHCGFCNATPLPDLGDEWTGRAAASIHQGVLGRRRGRPEHPTALDRCLTCINCETTCQSGVRYGKLVGIGRALVDQRVVRPWRKNSRDGCSRRTDVLVVRTRGEDCSARAQTRARRAENTCSAAGEPRAAAWPTRPQERQGTVLGRAFSPALRRNHSATARVLDACGSATLIARRRTVDAEAASSFDDQ